MMIINKPAEMQRRALAWKRAGRTVGFVPTMGYLHEGHASLMRLARPRCDVLVVSIFVNPAQFGPNEDLDAYPRDFERDEKLCAAEQVDAVFYPSAESMYAQDASVWIDEEALSAGLCGGSRPGHFRGVCTVVAKLFNLVQPDLAVFGEKDAQQLRIIERMVRDLNMPIGIVRGAIVREADGLAMSSRNRYLSPEERVSARCLREALDLAERLIGEGARSAEAVREAMRRLIEQTPGAVIDYLALVDDASLVPAEPLQGSILIALAVKIGTTRLIDNRVVFL